MDYYKKLLDPRWQKKRLEILQRDNFTCLICKSTTDTFHIHHEAYKNDPWDIDNKYLKTLCFRCHDVIELCKKKKIKYRNINRIEIKPEKFVYVINTKKDTFMHDGLFAYIIHNLNSDSFIMLPFCFSKEFIEYLLQTF